MRTATKQEAINGNSNDTVITPLRLKQVLSNVDINPGGGGGGSSDTPVYTAGEGISITNNVISNTITKTSQLTNDSNFITEADLPDININDPVPINSIFAYEGDTVPDGFIEYTGEIGGEGGGTSFEETDPTVPDYVKEITPEDIEKWNTGVDLTDYAKKNEIPKNLSQLENDSGFINAIPEDVLRKDTDVRVSNVVSRNLFNINNINPTYNLETSLSILENGIRATALGTGQSRYSAVELDKSLLGKTITLSANINASSTNSGALSIFFGTSSQPFLSSVHWFTESGSATFTIPSTFPSGCDKIFMNVYSNGGGTGVNGAYVDYTNIQIEEGSTATDYVPYLNLDEAMQGRNYSTSEVRIGTWIDGRPLYRKVITGTTNLTAGDLVIDLSSLNINYISKMDGTVGTNFDYKPINFYLEGNYISTRYAYGKMYLASTNAYTNLPFTMVLEYTKTTD